MNHILHHCARADKGCYHPEALTCPYRRHHTHGGNDKPVRLYCWNGEKHEMIDCVPVKEVEHAKRPM